VAGHADERLPGAGWRGEDDVVAGQEFEDCLFLGGVELQPDAQAVVDERIDQRVGVRSGGREVIEK
jgi:hypothetical protein